MIAAIANKRDQLIKSLRRRHLREQVQFVRKADGLSSHQQTQVDWLHKADSQELLTVDPASLGLKAVLLWPWLLNRHGLHTENFEPFIREMAVQLASQLKLFPTKQKEQALDDCLIFTLACDFGHSFSLQFLISLLQFKSQTSTKAAILAFQLVRNILTGKAVSAGWKQKTIQLLQNLRLKLDQFYHQVAFDLLCLLANDSFFWTPQNVSFAAMMFKLNRNELLLEQAARQPHLKQLYRKIRK